MSVLVSNMLLNVAQNVLHVVVLRVLSVSVVVGATSIAVRSGGELHVHDWRMLVREVLRLFVVVFGRAVTSLVEHQVPVRKAAVMHVCRSEFLLVLLDLVELGSHLAICVTSTHLSSENMASLGCSSLLAVLVSCHSRTTWTGSRSLSLNFCYNLHLIGVLHDKLASIASVGCTDAIRTLRAA